MVDYMFNETDVMWDYLEWNMVDYMFNETDVIWDYFTQIYNTLKRLYIPKFIALIVMIDVKK